MMPLGFQDRLFPGLSKIVEEFGTPFTIYDEVGIRQTCRKMKNSFQYFPDYRNYLAIKAAPEPKLIDICREEGMGADCSSIAELRMVRRIGFGPTDIIFSSNNTSQAEYREALARGGCITNLDDTDYIDQIPEMPETIFFRYNPGALRDGNEIIGQPEQAKYGIRDDMIVETYKLARERGAKKFGFHTMICSNQKDYTYMVETVKMSLAVIERIFLDSGIMIERMDIGGGFGIQYHPDDPVFNLDQFTSEAWELTQAFRERNGFAPRVMTECGRYVLGHHGVLVTSVINRPTAKYKNYVGVDACMSALMRPGMYGAYHHAYVLGGESRPTETVDIVGSLCENNDKFAIDRVLPVTKRGDIVVIADTGAHGPAMGFQYNGRVRPPILLRCASGQVKIIRHGEDPEDLFGKVVW
jgi:diaminopimelate decarboxylase